MTEMTPEEAKDNFELYGEQNSRDGNDIVRYVYEVMKDSLAWYTEHPDYIPAEGLTIQGVYKLFDYLLNDIRHKKWREWPKTPREDLLSSGHPSDRMQQLLNGDIDPSQDDVAELLDTFMGAASYTDYWAGSYTLVEFGRWLCGEGYFKEFGPAKVIW